jgi:hypothetical protein
MQQYLKHLGNTTTNLMQAKMTTKLCRIKKYGLKFNFLSNKGTTFRKAGNDFLERPFYSLGRCKKVWCDHSSSAIIERSDGRL